MGTGSRIVSVETLKRQYSFFALPLLKGLKAQIVLALGLFSVCCSLFPKRGGRIKVRNDCWSRQSLTQAEVTRELCLYFLIKWSCQGRILCPSKHTFLMSALISVNQPFLFPIFVPPTPFSSSVLSPLYTLTTYSPSSCLLAYMQWLVFHTLPSLLSQTSQILRMLFHPTAFTHRAPTSMGPCAVCESSVWKEPEHKCSSPTSTLPLGHSFSF